MNSKELLEQAGQRISEVEKIKLAMTNVKDMQFLLGMVDDAGLELCFCSIGGDIKFPLEQYMDIDNYTEIRNIIKVTFQGYLTEQMEQLLGVAPVISNTESEDKESISICADSSVPISIEDKSPAKKKRLTLPEEGIRRMYVDEGRSAKEIAEHYNADMKQISNFINRHGLRRRSYARTKDIEPAPAETERP